MRDVKGHGGKYRHGHAYVDAHADPDADDDANADIDVNTKRTKLRSLLVSTIRGSSEQFIQTLGQQERQVHAKRLQPSPIAADTFGTVAAVTSGME